jgi:hypothetical protein
MIGVLGGILWLQWRLLSRSLRDGYRVALCFALTLFMLQPDSYWGYENLAYHQALPLVFILAAIEVIFLDSRWWQGPLVLIFGLLAGFAYISGAIAALASALALCACATFIPVLKEHRGLLGKGIWYLAAGLVASIVQVKLAIVDVRSQYEGVLPALAMPYDTHFWWYFLGKIGRSLLLPAGDGWPSIASAFVMCVLVAGVTIMVLARMRDSRLSLETASSLAIYMAIFSLVAVYVFTVSAGRAGYALHEGKIGSSIYSFAFLRFHFFWVALIWPWLAAALLILLSSLEGRHRRFLDGLGLFVVFMAVIWVVKAGGMAHMESQRVIGDHRKSAMNCLLEGVQVGGEIHCPGLRPGKSTDSAGAYAYARRIDASFVRYLPVMPLREEYEYMGILYEYPGTGNVELNEMQMIAPGKFHVFGGDPWMRIDIENERALQSCLVLSVDVDIKIDLVEAAHAQLFYLLPSGQDGFSERYSQVRMLSPGISGFQRMHFQVESEQGFKPFIRFDPVSQARDLVIGSIKARCRVKNR